MIRRARALAVALVVAIGAAIGGPAAADSKDRCIAESETGQRLLLTRKFVDSRAHLVACGRAECPTEISRDCIERLRQAEASSASVVLSAPTGDGDIRVHIDASPIVHHPSGEAVWLDPGAHRFRFERADGAVSVRDVTVEEGARLVRVNAQFEPQSATTAPSVAPSAEPSRAWSSRRKLAGTLGAGGVVAIAAGAAFGLVARSHQASERSECASPTMCIDHAAALADYDSARHYGTASTIAFAAGGVLLATGIVLWVTAPSRRAAGSDRTAIVTPILSPDGAGIALQRAF